MVNLVSIVINMVGKLKEASAVDEESRDSVTNLTAVVVSGSDGEDVCHLVRVTVGEGQDIQFKAYLKSWSPSWYRK